jgi:GntR family transcriptional regulator
MIPRSRADAVYMRLARILRERIDAGVYAPGRPLPSEPRLGQEFGVARETVRRAVRELAVEGLVSVRPGVGTFVAEPCEPVTVALRRGTTFVVRMPTPAEVEAYGIPQGQPVLVAVYGVNAPEVISTVSKTFKTS